MKIKFTCPDCHGENILTKVWTNINTDEIVEEWDNERYWCDDCMKEVTPVEVPSEEK